MSFRPAAVDRFACLVVLALTMVSGRAADDFRVEIVPAQVESEQKILVSRKHPEFAVAVTNVSDHLQTIWGENCIGADESITFTITGADGHHCKVRRVQQYTVTMVGTHILRPGERYDYHFSFQTGRWEGFPRGFAAGEVVIRANFAVKEDADSARFHLWVGSASSEGEVVYLNPRLVPPPIPLAGDKGKTQ